jgi:cyclohexanone monooxygenase
MSAPNTQPSAPAPAPDVDVLIVGAGLNGLAMLHEARTHGLRVRIVEAAPEVGGTWYFNRYPGARTDSESWMYSYSFDRDLQQEWDWPERYPAQADMLRYLQHVADRFDMRRDISFNTQVEAAWFDENVHLWFVRTDQGETICCRFLVSAAGQLAKVVEPDFPGLESFRGDIVVTARWPEHDPDMWEKRVAVIGTGATGVQLIPVVAEMASKLTVFQRTANWVLPARNYTVSPAKMRRLKATYDELWRLARSTPSGMGVRRTERRYSDVTPEEAERIFEGAWEQGGLSMQLTTFADLVVDEKANEAVGSFIRRKIRAIVRDPRSAELLCPAPENLYGARRIPLGHHYYETFNRDNVELVDVSDNPITEMTPTGLRLADGSEHEVDVVIFALGFDAYTGAHSAMDIRGTDGQTLAQRWSQGAATFFSMAVDGFPNFFLLGGPHVPLGNALVAVEAGGRWVADLIEHTCRAGMTRVEVTSDAVALHGDRMDRNLQATLLRHGGKLGAWFLGANIPGKPVAPLLNYGGILDFKSGIDTEQEDGYPSFTFGRAASPVDVGA